MTRRRLGLGAVAALSASTVALVAAGLGSSDPLPHPRAPAQAGPRLPAPVTPAFTPGAPRPLAAVADRSHWAPVLRGVAARRAPAGAAPPVGTLRATTPEGTRNVVSVLERRSDAAGRTWVRVGLPVLPAGTTGWVPRTALGGYQTVVTRLDVDLRRLRATLHERGRPVLRMPVAVGMAGWETPRGRFYVRNRLTRYASPEYGPVAFGTSARSPRATGWPAGGFIGIHGTDRPDLVPGRVSHGCVRVRNADAVRLAARMPVGTPVVIH